MLKSKTIVSIFTVVCATFFVAVIVFAWTEPSVAPPGGNVDTPLNTGVTAQTKDGRLSATEFYDANDSQWYINPNGKSVLFGPVEISGDIIDGSDNIIYNSLTKKIERNRLPFEQGDITSDYEDNYDSSDYYDVANLASSTVKSGIVFGRNQTGSYTCPACNSCCAGCPACPACNSCCPACPACDSCCAGCDECTAAGDTSNSYYCHDDSPTASPWDVKAGKTAYLTGGELWTGKASCVQITLPSASTIKSGTNICGVAGTMSAGTTQVRSVDLPFTTDWCTIGTDCAKDLATSGGNHLCVKCWAASGRCACWEEDDHSCGTSPIGASALGAYCEFQ